MRNSKDLSKAFRAVESTLETFDIARAVKPHMAKVHWTQIVGPQVAAVTQVESIRGGNVLVVRVKNGVWANELTMLKLDILKRLNRAIGSGSVLEDIHFKASGLSRSKIKQKIEDPIPDDVELASVVLPPETQDKIQKSIQKITDPELRARVANTLTKMAQANEWKRHHGWLSCEKCGSLVQASELIPNQEQVLICVTCRAIAVHVTETKV